MEKKGRLTHFTTRFDLSVAQQRMVRDCQSVGVERILHHSIRARLESIPNSIDNTKIINIEIVG